MKHFPLHIKLAFWFEELFAKKGWTPETSYTDFEAGILYARLAAQREELTQSPPPTKPPPQPTPETIKKTILSDFINELLDFNAPPASIKKALTGYKADDFKNIEGAAATRKILSTQYNNPSIIGAAPNKKINYNVKAELERQKIKINAIRGTVSVLFSTKTLNPKQKNDFIGNMQTILSQEEHKEIFPPITWQKPV